MEKTSDTHYGSPTLPWAVNAICENLLKNSNNVTAACRHAALGRGWLCSPRTVARQAPLSVGFSSQEHWSGLPFPSPGDLPDPRIKSASPALEVNYLPPTYKWHVTNYTFKTCNWISLTYICISGTIDIIKILNIHPSTPEVSSCSFRIPPLSLYRSPHAQSTTALLSMITDWFTSLQFLEAHVNKVHIDGITCYVWTPFWGLTSDFLSFNHESIVCSILPPSNIILLCGYTTICLKFFKPFMDIWVISSVGLLQISCYEHSCTKVYVDMCFPISWVNI